MKDTSLDEFELNARTRRVVPVVRTLFADAETPIGIYRKLGAERPGTFLLESAEQGGIWSRYSFIGASSYGILSEQRGRAIWLDADPEHSIPVERVFGRDLDCSPLEAIEQLYARWHSEGIPGLPPLTGGLVGFVGWDAIREIEKLEYGPEADRPTPRQALCFVRELVTVDHLTGEVILLYNALVDQNEGVDGLWTEAVQALDRLQAKLAEPSAAWLARLEPETEPKLSPRVEAHDFKAAVESAKKRIQIGDIFQVVLSQRFDTELEASPLDVYRILRNLNPSPYLYFLALKSPQGEALWVVGSSPEALVKVTSGRAFTHPIAGSRPRGVTPELDLELAQDLSLDQKERAEHLMLVDLARNDLLKICVPGSVEVTEFMQVERFSHIMHLVSSVEGELLASTKPIDVFRATFPAGTLSGAPKPKALEIIDELEVSARGIYGGVVGYFGLNGDLDLAIAIRTALIQGSIASVQAGAGIVADSDPESEYQESVNKATAPLRAIAIANSAKKLQ